MSEKLRTLLPDSEIIFMSGYSDKEYLKAAINLKAVSYVEKPIDPAEVAEAIRLAADRLLEKGLAKRGRSLEEAENGNRLAELMTRVPADSSFDGLSFPEDMKPEDYFTSLILQFSSGPSFSANSLYRAAGSDVDPALAKYGLSEIRLIKENNCLCFFLYGGRPSRSDLRKLCGKIREIYEPFGVRYLALGDTFHGIKHAYNSYTSAVILLQGAFFNEPGSILASNDETSPSPSMIKDYGPEYAEALSTGNHDAALQLLNDLREQFRPPCRLMASQVKDNYYQLFLSLQKESRQSQISDVFLKGGRSIWDMVDSADTLDLLHAELARCTEDFFAGLSNRSTGSDMVYAIKEFIRQNYQNESLSIKSVSDHVNRSAPYVCTFFKAETGQTLNQYITGYRIERAQEMLADPRYKITDVASRTGYNDVNYFGKIFKKITGSSPSEYRSGHQSSRSTEAS